MPETEPKRSFDAVADLYHRSRPGYPEAATDLIALHARLTPESRVLEVGCGTGQATRPFAERGVRLLALELGPALAERARVALHAFPEVEVRTTPFEAWELEPAAFDLALSAHWIDPELGSARLAEALRPGGSAALMWNLDESHDTEFYRLTQPVYDRYYPRRDEGVGWSGWSAVVARYREALDAGGAFGPVVEHRFPWRTVYDRERYLTLLRTYSPTRALEPEVRERFVADIGEVVDAVGEVERIFVTTLLLARRRSG